MILRQKLKNQSTGNNDSPPPCLVPPLSKPYSFLSLSPQTTLVSCGWLNAKHESSCEELVSTYPKVARLRMGQGWRKVRNEFSQEYNILNLCYQNHPVVISSLSPRKSLTLKTNIGFP